jgi:4-hydroxythreonine-4-phosphate dehydrogenase
MIKIGISMGDPNGVGPEIILKAFNDSRLFENILPIVYGSNRVLSFYKKLIPNCSINYAKARSIDDLKTKQLNVISIWDGAFNIQPGKANKEGGDFAFKALEAATSDLASGKIDVLVTAPINKKMIQNDQFDFPGHTEYLTRLSNAEDSLMLMAYNNLRVGVATNHIPVDQVSSTLSKETIQSKLLLLYHSLKNDFGVLTPKIAVLGLNPHAGEQGMLGKEEVEIIQPAIDELKKNGLLLFGPFPADGFFGSKSFLNYDGVLAMYHDQGLIPFKTMAAGNGVNYTAGLPIVRTSPDHGTAYDIAGKNLANGDSLRNAAYLAVDVFNQRKHQKELAINPLKVTSK